MQTYKVTELENVAKEAFPVEITIDEVTREDIKTSEGFVIPSGTTILRKENTTLNELDKTIDIVTKQITQLQADLIELQAKKEAILVKVDKQVTVKPK